MKTRRMKAHGTALVVALMLVGGISESEADANTPRSSFISSAHGDVSGSGSSERRSNKRQRRSNKPPIIRGTPPQVVKVGITYSFAPMARDPNDDPLVFRIRNKPTWLGFNSKTGRIRGVPPQGSEGSYDNIRILVTDGRLSASLPSFTITVEPAVSENMPPEIDGNPPTAVVVGEMYSFAPTGSDPDGDPLTFSIDNQPSWAQFDSSTGELSGVPQPGDEGTYSNIAITVSDGVSTASLPAFSVIVDDEDSGSPPDDPTTPGPLASIPKVPFDYAKSPGAVTRSGALPGNLGAGEVLALSGQTVSDTSFRCSGTEANPAFILGGTLRGGNDVLQVSGSWCIFVDTVFDNVQVRTSGDHHVFRNVEIRNLAGKNGSSFGGSNIVVVDSEIHHNQGDDRHGVHVPSGANSIWILRNHIHHNGGDGFQACHGCASNPPRNVYIGQNLFHSDRENAIDFKYVENVIVEGNTIHSLVSAAKDQNWCFDDGSSCGTFSSGSDGSAIVIGSDGGPTNVLITGNEVYGTNNAVRIEEGTRVRIENNNFHDVENRCLQLDKDGFDTVYSGNTCANADRGIFQNWRDNFSLTVDNNVFKNLSGPAVEYESSSVGDGSTLTRNVFADSGPVVYGRVIAATEATINALPGAQGNQVE